MDQPTLRKFEAQCVQEEPPACQSSCPLHVEARTFIAWMAEGNIRKARQQLDRTLPLSCLTAFLCEGVCQEACKRSLLDDGLNMPLLERACVLNSSPSKTLPLPASGKKICVFGTGLSSLVIAWELAKKGHGVSISYTGSIGCDILHSAKERLPEKALAEAIEQLKNLHVEFVPCDGFDAEYMEMQLVAFDLLYLGLDDVAVAAASFPLAKQNGVYTSDAVTLLTEHPKILAGGNLHASGMQWIYSMADAKKATGSLDRMLQGVGANIAREGEESYETKLYTNLENVQIVPHTPPKDALVPQLDEAQAEALRCIQCACLECVKQCSFLAAYKAYPKRYMREMYNNLTMTHSVRLANTMTNSCAECGLCAKICPQGLDMGAFCTLARREMVETKRMPPSAHEFALEDMFFSNSEAVQFFRHQVGHTTSKYMFFPGCQLPAVLPEQVRAAYTHVCEHLSGGVGFHLGCCGMPARWASQDVYTACTVEAFRQTWEDAGKPTYITACASCSDFFLAHCPDIPQISLWEILASLPLPKKTGVLQNRTLAIHDPCSSRAFPSMQAGLRTFVTALKQETIELDYGREMTRCCGFGGLISEANPSIADSFVQNRIEDSDEALLVYCAICRERMQKLHKPCVHILELAFPVSAENLPEHLPEHLAKNAVEMALEKALHRSFLSIYERQDRRVTCKNTILAQVFGEKESTMPEISKDNTILLHLTSDVEAKLSERRIVRADIVAVLRHVEIEGAIFYNAQTGHSLASLRPRQVTYWVEYMKETDGSYRIFDAYCHRMLVPGVAGLGALPQFATACCPSEKQNS